MVNNSVLQSTLALISTQSFYNERARMGHGDLPLSIVTPSTLGQLKLSQRAMRPCQAVSNVGMDVRITDDAITVPTAQAAPGVFFPLISRLQTSSHTPKEGGSF